LGLDLRVKKWEFEGDEEVIYERMEQSLMG
jgi:hypothetical protein